MNKKYYYLDSFGLVLIGIFCLGYVLFDRPFAELNVQLPFLNFPIFIGEILLSLCLCIFLLKCDLQFNKKYFWIIGYFAFVIVKALCGYSKFGPLAFRDAALFYYPAFIIFANSFYRKDFFDTKKNILFLIIIIFLFTGWRFNEYWLLTCFTLAFILSYTYPRKVAKYLLLAMLFLVTPYALFFNTSRMMMVANFVAGVYLIIGLYFILEIRKEIKVGLVFLAMACVVLAFFSFSDRNSILGIVGGDKIFGTFRIYDMQIREAKQKSVSGKKEKPSGTSRVRIYNPDPPLSFSRLGKDNLVNAKEDSISIQSSNRVDQVNPVNKEAGVSVKEIKIQELLTVAPQDQGYSKRQSLAPRPGTGYQSMFLENKAPISNVRKESSYQPMAIAHVGEDKALNKIDIVPLDQEVKTQELSTVRIYNPDPPITLRRLGRRENISGRTESISEKPNSEIGVKGEVVKNSEQNSEIGAKGEVVKNSEQRSLEGAYINAIFRLFIWRDMLTELIREKPILGFHFGRPLRSISLETLKWGESEWRRDGWIAAHNSYLNMIYRAGIIGLSAILTLFVILFKMIRKSIQCRSLIGILLCGIIINWFVAANFLLIFELPYTAIPVWTLFGLTYAYLGTLKPYSETNLKFCKR